MDIQLESYIFKNRKWEHYNHFGKLCFQTRLLIGLSSIVLVASNGITIHCNSDLA